LATFELALDVVEDVDFTVVVLAVFAADFLAGVALAAVFLAAVFLAGMRIPPRIVVAAYVRLVRAWWGGAPAAGTTWGPPVSEKVRDLLEFRHGSIQR
jgi:hypothetical protein